MKTTVVRENTDISYPCLMESNYIKDMIVLAVEPGVTKEDGSTDFTAVLLHMPENNNTYYVGEIFAGTTLDYHIYKGNIIING